MEIGFWGTTIGIIVVVAVFVIYTNLEKNKNKVRDAYTKMDNDLRERWNLLSKFIEMLKSYPVYEEKTLEKFAMIQKKEYENFKIQQKIEIDNNISKVVEKMILMAEDYPNLISNKDYIKLKNELLNLDNEIEKIKKEYNEAVKKYNLNIETMPNNIIAILFGFNEEILLEVTNEKNKI